MYKRFKERFGTAGVVLGVIALILALGGTALAAKGALPGKQKKEVEKIAKKEAQKYANSNPGAPGAAGAKGDPGAAGSNGTNGIDGVDGTDGASVSGAAIGAGGACGTETGVKYTLNATSTNVCNGKEGDEGPEGPPGADGDPGPEGSPWTVGGVLPPGEQETGVWSFAATTSDTAGVSVPLSFPIKLPLPLEGHVHFETEENFFEKCHGGAENANADPGELCVYLNSSEGEFEEIKGLYAGIFSASFPEQGAAPQGALLKFSTPSKNISYSGTFAVRAPEATP